MASKKSTTRDGPRTGNRKIKRRQENVVLSPGEGPPSSPKLFMHEGEGRWREEDARPLEQAALTPRPDLTGTEPKPWDCLCGKAHNSAIVEQCPVCKTRRPFDYTPPVPENAPFQGRYGDYGGHPVREDWPQPDESPDDYAKRMDEARGRELPEQGSEVTPSAGVSHVAGYYCPIEFAGPVGSVSVDPALVQQVVDLTNAAARSAAVRSVTIGVKNPQQARLVFRVDFDLGEAGVRTVADV